MGLSCGVREDVYDLDYPFVLATYSLMSLPVGAPALWYGAHLPVALAGISARAT